MKFRFHVLGIPHTISDPEWSACAFTMKAMKFSKMMVERGHVVYHYGHEDSKVVCTEHVSVVPRELFNATYGKVDWRNGYFQFDTKSLCYETFYMNASEAIKQRFQPLDIILLFWGYGHKPIADDLRSAGLKNAIFVEPGIGYPLSGIVEENFKVFESYSIMNRYLGYLEAKGANASPRFYDVVIPNYFDPSEFTSDDRERTYFLYLGRITRDKGLPVIIDICQETGVKLKVAGQGNLESAIGKKVPDFVEFLGYANPEKRRELLAGAKALFAPSIYSEPFGGIAVEAMISGTPVITTDWGAFPETVLHGITGFRCRTMQHFKYAVKNIDKIDRKTCREWAINNFSLDKIVKMYEEYFTNIVGLYTGKDFYYMGDREELDWLKPILPNCNENMLCIGEDGGNNSSSTAH